MTAYSVNLQALQDGIDAISACHRSLVSQQDDLKRTLQPLAATWLSQSGENWETEKQRWDGKADDVYTVLFNLRTALQNSHDNYSAVNTAVAQSMVTGG